MEGRQHRVYEAKTDTEGTTTLKKSRQTTKLGKINWI